MNYLDMKVNYGFRGILEIGLKAFYPLLSGLSTFIRFDNFMRLTELDIFSINRIKNIIYI
jgi:hypothetical protein